MSEWTEAKCSSCGHVEQVRSALGLAPTFEIVRAVCERDPCPVCGERAMEAWGPLVEEDEG
jgi:hypothetical protein